MGAFNTFINHLFDLIIIFFLIFQFIKHLLKSKSFVGVPKIYVYVVDVRDLAKLVFKALNSNAAAGSRHIVFSKGMFLNEVSQVISKEFKTQGKQYFPILSQFFFLLYHSYFFIFSFSQNFHL